MTRSCKELRANGAPDGAVAWREQRKRCGLSARDVAAMTGFSEKMVTAIERGDSRPGPMLRAQLTLLYERWRSVEAQKKVVQEQVRALRRRMEA